MELTRALIRCLSLAMPRLSPPGQQAAQKPHEASAVNASLREVVRILVRLRPVVESAKPREAPSGPVENVLGFAKAVIIPRHEFDRGVNSSHRLPIQDTRPCGLHGLWHSTQGYVLHSDNNRLLLPEIGRKTLLVCYNP